MKHGHKPWNRRTNRPPEPDEALARRVLTVARLELLRLRVPPRDVDERLVRVCWTLLGWLSSAEAGEGEG
jgi:hypothetical protein